MFTITASLYVNLKIYKNHFYIDCIYIEDKISYKVKNGETISIFD